MTDGMTDGSHDPTRLWRRTCSLIVDGAGGAGLDLGDLRVVFETRKGDAETPNHAIVTVFNLSAQTAARIGGEFDHVALAGGYAGRMGTLFSGTIRQVRRGRERGTDGWVEIVAADGDRAYNGAVVSRTLAAGATPADQIGVAMEALAAQGAAPGHVAALGGQPLPRGKVLFGMARRTMRAVAEDRQANWSIQDGRVQVLPLRATLPGQAIVLTHETGLLDAPEQTDDGIRLVCLLDPRLAVGGTVRIDNASVVAARTDLRRDAARRPASLDHDGIYRILQVEHRGDTHGQDWASTLLCIAIDDTSRLPLDRIGVED